MITEILKKFKQVLNNISNYYYLESGELEKKIKEEATEYIKEKKDDML